MLFDLPVGRRLRRQLVERCIEQASSVLVSTLPAADEAEVCDHLTLVPLVPELPQEHQRLLEVLDRNRDRAGMNEGEREIVECERLCAAVVQITHDRQRGAMLLGGSSVLPITSQLSSDLVELTRAVPRVGDGCLPRTNLESVPRLLRGAVRKAPQTLPGVELVERRP